MALFTKWAKDLDKACPHNYHPRPSFKRESFTILNGEWDFALSKERDVAELDKKIIVPFCPESALSGIEIHPASDEYMHYRRGFTSPEIPTGGRLFLHFGAVDQECEVFLNSVRVGENRGGYLPFTVDITDAVRKGENTLYVRVRDTLDKKYPYGKQTEHRGGMWYTPVSGIWQTVWLECVPENAIEEIRITPSLDGAMITVIGGAESKLLTLSSGEVFSFCGNEFFISPAEIHLWSPEDPYLYDFTLECGEDRIESYFALRTVGVEQTNGRRRLTLNGKPYIFNGLLDQGYYPDGLFMPATVDGYIYDVKLAKELGFNMLRKHIKIEPDIFYYLCDKMGIAVFQDMVNNGSYSFLRDTALPTIGLQKMSDRLLHRCRESRRIFTETMLGTAELLYNHPSVVYYTIFNEGWGQFLADEAYDTLKRKDETRIIDSTSGWFRRERSDVDSRHVYFKALRLKGRDERPAVISEFGGYSYREEGHLFGKKNYGYRLFGSREEFENAFIELYEDEVIPLIKDGADAFVYTQLSDVEDETNGLCTYDREVVKLSPERCREVMYKLYSHINDK